MLLDFAKLQGYETEQLKKPEEVLLGAKILKRAYQNFVKFAKSPKMQKVFKDAGVLEQTIQLCSKTIKVDK